MDALPNLYIDLEEEWKSSYKELKPDKKQFKKESYLPLTELAVNLSNEFVDNDLGRVDMYTASDFLHRRSLTSSTPLLLGLLYSRRWRQREQLSPDPCSWTSAELFLVSMMVASKYLYDEGTRDDVFNDEWASDFPGLETDDLNRLEAEFLTEMDWDLFVKPSEFADFLSVLEVRLAENLARRRDWRTTYKEMKIFLSSKDIRAGMMEAVQLIAEAASLLALVYSCAVLSVYVSVIAVRFAHPTVSCRLAPVLNNSSAVFRYSSELPLFLSRSFVAPRAICKRQILGFNVHIHVRSPSLAPVISG